MTERAKVLVKHRREIDAVRAAVWMGLNGTGPGPEGKAPPLPDVTRGPRVVPRAPGIPRRAGRHLLGPDADLIDLDGLTDARSGVVPPAWPGRLVPATGGQNPRCVPARGVAAMGKWPAGATIKG